MKTLSIIGIVLFSLCFFSITEDDLDATLGSAVLSSLGGLALAIVVLVNLRKKNAHLGNDKPNKFVQLKELHELKQQGIIYDADFSAKKDEIMQG